MSNSAANKPGPELTVLQKGKRKPARRERVREVGMSGNNWFAVELDSAVGRGEVKEVIFWGTSIAVFRGEDGVVRAVENRCAHRQLRLSEGAVEGNELMCTYHGWSYDGNGDCTHISHELGMGRKKMPKICIRSFPVRIKYGFIWLFPGDPAKADATPLPKIPQLDQAEAWAFTPIDLTIEAHFSMIVENVCDFNHEYLHRDLRPFSKPKLQGWSRVGDTIHIDYETKVGGKGVEWFTERGGKGLDYMKLWYQYPYQGSDTKGKYLHWLFMLPIDEKTTRCFFVFLFGPLELPGVRLHIPHRLRGPVLAIANRFYIKPLLAQDKWALEEEQRAHERHKGMPSYELNPIVREFQKLTIEKWEDYVESERERVFGHGNAHTRVIELGAGLRRDELERDAADHAERVSLEVLA